MRTRHLVLLALLVLAAPAPATAVVRTSGGLSLGASHGLGGQADVTFSELAQGMPFSLRAAVGYWRLDPGDPVEARHVFINANDDGDPTERGRRWDLRLDALRQMQRGFLKDWWVGAGPRYSMFRGDFDFVGGNETFFIDTSQWGLGALLERRWPTGPETELVMSGGLDWFANATLKGHDSSYSPDGSSVSPVDAYGWKEADAAIHQPRFAPRFVVGLQHHFGR
jgi:hypothetical protein